MTWVVPARGHPREAVIAPDHPMAAVRKVFELGSAPAEGPTRVGVLDPVQEVVQPKVLIDGCNQFSVGDVAPSVLCVAGTILVLVSRAPLGVIIVGSLGIFGVSARCFYKVDRLPLGQPRELVHKVEHRVPHSFSRPRLVVGPRLVWRVGVAVSREDVVDVPEQLAGCTTCLNRRHMHDQI